MKKLKLLLRKTLFFTMILTVSISMNSGASDNWQQVYEQDFSLFDESVLTNENFPEGKVGYTTEVADEALEIKSDNTTDWQVRDDSYPSNTANNSKGIKITNGTSASSALKKHDPPFEADNLLFDYTGTSSTAWVIENIGGKNALRILSFPKEDKVDGEWKYVTLEYRFSVDEGRFDKSRRAYDVELDLYFPSGKKPSFVEFLYTSANGSKSVKLSGDAMKAMPTDTWTTWKFTVDDANFGEVGLFYGSVKANFILTQSNYNYSKTATTYVGRVSVNPSTSGEYIYTPLEKTVKFPLKLGDVYGNTRVTFDMNLPVTERYSDLNMYNSGYNSARVSLANENDYEIAAVQVDSTDDSQSIYAITEDAGEEVKELLYEGEILGQMLTYQIEVDWKANAYTVVIKNANELLDENHAIYGPFKIANSSLVRGNVLVRNFSIKHNSASEMMMTVLDNILVDYVEDPDYANCKADANELSLEHPDVVTEGFALPTVGANGTGIAWKSSDTDVITINDTGDACTIRRAATRVTVTLTATLETNGVKILKDFDITVEKSEDQLKVEDDVAAVTIEIPPSGLVIEDFDLPTLGTVHGTDITWESSNPDVITINPGNDGCTLTRGATQVKVTLTATATFNGYTATKDFVIIVCEHDDFLKAKADAWAIVLDIPETGRVKDAFTLPSLGTVNGSAVTWTTSDTSIIAISGNTAQVTRFDSNKDVTLTASATLNGFTATREFALVSATLRGVKAEIYDVEETISGGYLSASLDVQYPGKSGTLNFLAVVIDPETGEILARDIFTKNLTNNDSYSTVTCTVSGLPFVAGNETNYYVWNDKRESYVNNAPTAVTELTAEGRGKGVRLNWEASVDDNNSVEYYAVYRDGNYIGTALQETYFDETAELGMVYDYEVRGVDTNDRYSAGELVESTPVLGMYYYNFDKQGRGETDYNNGIDYKSSNRENDQAYSWIAKVVDSNGEECYAATSTKRYILGMTDKSCISGEVRDMIFEVVYLDTSGSINMIYNQVIPPGESDSLTYAYKELKPISAMQGTYEWKTAVFSVSNASFRNSSLMSGCDFGFTASTEGNMFIKEIRIIQADLYN